MRYMLIIVALLVTAAATLLAADNVYLRKHYRYAANQYRVESLFGKITACKADRHYAPLLKESQERRAAIIASIDAELDRVFPDYGLVRALQSDFWGPQEVVLSAKCDALLDRVASNP